MKTFEVLCLILYVLCASVFCAAKTMCAAESSLQLPSVFSDHMVIQARKPVSIWGKSSDGEAIVVEFAGQTKSTTANASGEWQLKLDPLAPSNESRELRIQSTIIKDVFVGEVWLASGQSNMEMQLKDKSHGLVDNSEAEIENAKHPEIRFFMVDQSYSIYDLSVPPDVASRYRSGKWVVCSPESAASFSAMGYFFARDLLAEIKQPIGIITAAVGGTPIESWMSLSSQSAVTEFKLLHDDWSRRLGDFVPEKEQQRFLEAKTRWLKQRSDAVKAGQSVPKAPLAFKNIAVMKPGGLFNGLIAPLIPYTMRGVIWYQGERNAAGPFTGLYGLQLRTLISNWRMLWNDDLHFAWVQLPAFQSEQKFPSEPNGWGVAVRDEMRRTLAVPHTSMAITIDLGGEKNGHPTNKADYAKRLSTVVLHDVYQKPINLPTGPLFKVATTSDSKMIVTFDFADGLKANSGELEGFAIAGADMKFVWANAKIKNDQVVVWSDKILAPQAVRYSWAGNPKGNLVNAAELPASPFRTDDWQ